MISTTTRRNIIAGDLIDTPQGLAIVCAVTLPCKPTGPVYHVANCNDGWTVDAVDVIDVVQFGAVQPQDDGTYAYNDIQDAMRRNTDYDPDSDWPEFDAAPPTR